MADQKTNQTYSFSNYLEGAPKSRVVNSINNSIRSINDFIQALMVAGADRTSEEIKQANDSRATLIRMRDEIWKIK